MSYLTSIIEEGLERKGLSAARASILAVKNAGMIKNIRNGSSPSYDNLCKLLNVLGFEISIHLPANQPAKPSPPPIRTIPVIGAAACGSDGWWHLGTNDLQAKMPDRNMSDNSFAVIATGDSLNPFGIFAGAICFCDPALPLETGHFAFIERKIEGSEQTSMTIKRVGVIGTGALEIYGFRPTVEKLSDTSYAIEMQESFWEVVPKSHIIRSAPVCWVNTNPVL